MTDKFYFWQAATDPRFGFKPIQTLNSSWKKLHPPTSTRKKITPWFLKNAPDVMWLQLARDYAKRQYNAFVLIGHLEHFQSKNRDYTLQVGNNVKFL